MDKFNKWDNTLDNSLFENLVLSKIPKFNTKYDISYLMNKFNIKIIIDLSTSENSYQIPDDVRYYKFNFEKKKIPEEYKINEILKILNENKDVRILIHCHYGFNRTGFVFINYLCSNGYNLASAIEIFKKIRGKGVKYPEMISYLENKFE